MNLSEMELVCCFPENNPVLDNGKRRFEIVERGLTSHFQVIVKTFRSGSWRLKSAIDLQENELQFVRKTIAENITGHNL